MANVIHLAKNGRLHCKQKSLYPLDTTDRDEEVTCQYCLRGPKLGKRIKKYASGPRVEWRKITATQPRKHQVTEDER